MATGKRGPRPSVDVHAHSARADEPADYRGRRVCAACGKPGQPGDVQHPPGALPLSTVLVRKAIAARPAVPEGWSDFEARRLGEPADPKTDTEAS